MYIKIKYIQFFLLLVACFSLAGFNYLNYAIADNNTDKNVCNKTIDADCDGLTDVEEKLYGTDLNNTDTDGDSYSDGVEIRSGYDPLKPAPGDKIDTGKNTQKESDKKNNTTDKTTLTDEYLYNLTTYLSSKESPSFSAAEINTFIDEQLTEKMGGEITLDTLPTIDQSQIKIIKQDYSNLNEEDRKSQKNKDALDYMHKMAYILITNAPVRLVTASDFSNFADDLLSHLSNLSNLSNADYEYFSDLGNRLEVVLDQTSDVEVPETLLDLHIKFLRIIKGFLMFREMPSDSDDPMSQLILSTKIEAYAKLFGDFFQNDFIDYFNSI